MFIWRSLTLSEPILPRRPSLRGADSAVCPDVAAACLLRMREQTTAAYSRSCKRHIEAANNTRLIDSAQLSRGVRGGGLGG